MMKEGKERQIGTSASLQWPVKPTKVTITSNATNDQPTTVHQA
jgi:hypothetical protein